MVNIWWMKLKLFIILLLSGIIRIGREIMLYAGFTVIMVGLILTIDKTFLGGILSPLLIEFIQGIL